MGGGGGFFGDGVSYGDKQYGYPGSSFRNNSLGGAKCVSSSCHEGGFGGGGSTHEGSGGGGGGGGYSGGGGGTISPSDCNGGGGASYNNGKDPSFAVHELEHGKVMIGQGLPSEGEEKDYDDLP